MKQRLVAANCKATELGGLGSQPAPVARGHTSRHMSTFGSAAEMASMPAAAVSIADELVIELERKLKSAQAELSVSKQREQALLQEAKQSQAELEASRKKESVQLNKVR